MNEINKKNFNEILEKTLPTSAENKADCEILYPIVKKLCELTLPILPRLYCARYSSSR